MIITKKTILLPRPQPLWRGSRFKIEIPEGKNTWGIVALTPIDGQQVIIDWGDGTTTEYVSSADLSHTFTESGLYDVTINDAVARYKFSNTRSTYRDRYAKYIKDFSCSGIGLMAFEANSLIGCDNLSVIHLAGEIEEVFTSSEEYQTDPTFGQPGVTFAFDL